MPEICQKSPFLQILFGFFLHISLFFPTKKNINSNTHHQACFNCQKNLFLKSELSKNRRNSQFSPEKQYFLNISSCTWYFFMKFCTLTSLTQNDNVQNVTDLIFEKKFFAGKTGFLAFSRDFIISFFWFFAQRCVLTMLKIWPSLILKKKFFSGRKCRKYGHFCKFSLDFFHIFLCFFTKDWFIIMPMIKAESIVNNNWFLHLKLSKNLYSTRYPHQQLMIRFNTLCVFVDPLFSDWLLLLLSFSI